MPNLCMAAPFGKVANMTGQFVVTSISVGGDPDGVAVAPDGRHVYVSNQISNTVSVIDTTTNAVLTTIVVGNLPADVAVAPDGRHVYVANEYSNTVSVIDSATNAVVTTILGDAFLIYNQIFKLAGQVL